ncbi:hypothetical protein SOVF_068610 [Spinacia oleracea]|nr:hypothetical protein SOVF_068610 [Spinacia oleracea]
MIMGEMKVKKWVVGSKVFLLLIIAIMVGTCCVVARNIQYSEQPEKEQQLLLKISNILLEGVRGGGGGGVNDDNNLSCWAQGEACSPFISSKRCCDGYSCDSYRGRCEWCPRKGDSCGLNDPCCPGLSCNDWLKGTCS